jgi:hypothetical protein
MLSIQKNPYLMRARGVDKATKKGLRDELSNRREKLNESLIRI